VRVLWAEKDENSPESDAFRGPGDMEVAEVRSPPDTSLARAGQAWLRPCLLRRLYATVSSAEPGLVTCVSGSSAVAVEPAATGGSRDFGWIVSFAKPKSRIFVCPRFVTKIFAGSMSRCTMSRAVKN